MLLCCALLCVVYHRTLEQLVGQGFSVAVVEEQEPTTTVHKGGKKKRRYLSGQ